jgi:hypothetical protein
VDDELVVQQAQCILQPSIAKCVDELLDERPGVHGQSLSGTPTARRTYSGGTSKASDVRGNWARTSSDIAAL